MSSYTFPPDAPVTTQITDAPIYCLWVQTGDGTITQVRGYLDRKATPPSSVDPESLKPYAFTTVEEANKAAAKIFELCVQKDISCAQEIIDTRWRCKVFINPGGPDGYMPDDLVRIWVGVMGRDYTQAMI